MSAAPELMWQEAERHVSSDEQRADALYRLLQDDPVYGVGARLRLSLLNQRRGHYRNAVDQALAAFASPTDDPALLALLCKRLFVVGEFEAAIECAAAPSLHASDDVEAIAEIGKLMTDAFQPDVALRLLHRARELGLDTPGLDYLIGLALMYQGRIDAAEHELQRCLLRAPTNARAHWVLSKLRRWTSTTHHVDRINRVIERTSPASPDLPLLHYALFKEFDDLGEYRLAWKSLESGMHARRLRSSYSPEQDRALFDQLMTFRPTRYPASRGQGDDGPVPIFIVGLPRSGTTLLERILCGHPDVTDAGELHDFVFQLRWMCDLGGGPYLDYPLSVRAGDADLSGLGVRYLSHTRMRSGGTRFFTDKMPANFLNIGHIVAALPRAKILHMVRADMDVCFSNLKELFAGAYPHSYNQIEMADHYMAYRRLMDHWHAVAPGRILDVHYEALVTDTDAAIPAIFAHCGLLPIADSGRIENRGGTVATASAVQVREPIHARNVGQWERYAEWLTPMRARLGPGR